MKLRIRGNSIRLRLLRGEVQRLAEEGRVAETTRFPSGAELIYSIECHEAGEIEARFEGASLRVILPKAKALVWALSDEISLEGEQPNGDGTVLKLLVEKDFTCINPRAVWQEDQSDNYPNPHPNCGGTHG